jgi:hypothetical protein
VCATAAMVSVALVAPAIGVFAKSHWYVSGSREVAVTVIENGWDSLRVITVGAGWVTIVGRGTKTTEDGFDDTVPPGFVNWAV